MFDDEPCSLSRRARAWLWTLLFAACTVATLTTFILILDTSADDPAASRVRAGAGVAIGVAAVEIGGALAAAAFAGPPLLVVSRVFNLLASACVGVSITTLALSDPDEPSKAAIATVCCLLMVISFANATLGMFAGDSESDSLFS